MEFIPCLVRTPGAAGGELIRLGHPLLDAYVGLVAALALWNTVLASEFALHVFYTIITEQSIQEATADVIALMKAHRDTCCVGRTTGRY